MACECVKDYCTTVVSSREASMSCLKLPYHSHWLLYQIVRFVLHSSNNSKLVIITTWETVECTPALDRFIELALNAGFLLVALSPFCSRRETFTCASSIHPANIKQADCTKLFVQKHNIKLSLMTRETNTPQCENMEFLLKISCVHYHIR